jgi:uncharacterized protein with HEPN domain
MHADARKLVWDARQAIVRVLDFTQGKSFSDYQRDLMLRSAVERQLEIAGEALAKLRRVDAQTAAAIGDLPRVVGFRNVLIHGYATVDDRLVWGVIENHASSLRDALDALLQPND